MNTLRGSLTNTQEGRGTLGFKGETGLSAYELAVKNGYEGTEQEWINHFGLDLSGYVETSDVVDNLTSTYTTRPLSAKQGKVLNEAINDLKPVVLYNNPSGSNSTIELSDSVTNYSFIEIYYHSNDDYEGYKKLIAQNGNTVLYEFQPQTNNEDALYLKLRVITINGNTISTRQGSTGYYIKEVFFSTNGYQQYANNYIYITKVLGYK